MDSVRPVPFGTLWVSGFVKTASKPLCASREGLVRDLQQGGGVVWLEKPESHSDDGSVFIKIPESSPPEHPAAVWYRSDVAKEAALAERLKGAGLIVKRLEPMSTGVN